MRGPQVFSVYQVTRYLKSLLLKDRLLQDISVTGEISNYKHHKPSGHIYFTLKDDRSVLRCVFFRGDNQGLDFEPSEGMNVICRGNISLYERNGTYQLYVREMEPEGLGALYMAFEKLKEKLQEEGLFEAKHKKPLPRFPRKIGLITSPSGAAVRDFLTTLRRRYPAASIVIHPAAVQGREAPEQLAAALQKMDASGEYDILVLTRGGGSLEELWAFNDERLARFIFEAATPVVSAVGHETDFTIADFVADRRASTPTAAAELVVPDKLELERYLKERQGRLGNILQNKLHLHKMLLDRYSRAMAFRYPQELINQGHQRVDELSQRMLRSLTHGFALKDSRLKSLADRLQSLNPLEVMKRGFCLASDQKGRLLTSSRQLAVGEDILVAFQDGEAGCRVKTVKERSGLQNSGRRDADGTREEE